MPFCASLSIGVNVFIVIVILTLGFLFSLPLKFILTENSVSNTKIVSIDDQKEFSVDFRGLRLCENLGYVSFIKSLFIICGYDGNCTKIMNGMREAPPMIGIGEKISQGGKQVENYHGNFSENERKSVSIAGHIIGVMLVLSALAALVEVLRVRLFEAKQPDHGDGPSPHHGVRRCSSLIDLGQRRKVKKETVQAQKSFEIHGMMHRSPLRLLAAKIERLCGMKIKAQEKLNPP